MISLFIDTSSSTTILALFREYNEISFVQDNNKNDVSSRIMVLLDNMLSDAKVKLGDIKKIFVVNGPGSFTGLRIGVTIAKTLSWSLNIPVIPISSLEVLASTNFEADYIVPYIDARRGYVFSAIYDCQLNTIIDGQYIYVNSLLSYLAPNKKYMFVGREELGLQPTISPNVDISKIIRKHWNDNSINPHTLIPNYLKKTEAEEKLNSHVEN